MSKKEANHLAITKRKKYLELIRNSGLFGLGLFGAKLIQLLLLPYFTNKFSNAQYGTIDLSITFVELMRSLLTLNICQAVLRFGMSREIDKKALVKNTSLVLLFSILISFALLPLLTFYQILYPWRFYIVALVIVYAVRDQCSVFMKAEEKIGLYAFDSFFLAAVVGIFDVLLIAGFDLGIEGYFIAEIIGYISSTVFLIVKGKIYCYFDLRSPIDKKLLGEMLKYSVPLMLTAISWWITSVSDRMILGNYSGEGDVGIYAIAAKFPNLITNILSVFSQAWLISAVKEYENDRKSVFFSSVCKIYTNLLFFLIAVGILIIKPVLKVYVGLDFFDAWRYVPYLLIGTVFLSISGSLNSIYMAAKKNSIIIVSVVLCAVSNLILNFILIPRAGIMGAVVATMCSYFIMFLIQFIAVRQIVFIDKKLNYMIAGNVALIFGESYAVINNYYIIGCIFGVGIALLNGVPLRKGLVKLRK